MSVPELSSTGPGWEQGSLSASPLYAYLHQTYSYPLKATILQPATHIHV